MPCKDIVVIMARAWTVMNGESTGIDTVVLARAVCLSHAPLQTCIHDKESPTGLKECGWPYANCAALDIPYGI